MATVQGVTPGGQDKPRELEISRLDDGRVMLWIYNPPRDDPDKGWAITVEQSDLLSGLTEAGVGSV